MLPRLRKRVTDLEDQLRAYNAFRRGAGGTTNRERDAIRAELDEARKELKDVQDNPTPREAPEGGRARRPAGNARRLDAEFADRATGPDDESRGEQVVDVLTRADESRRRQSSQAQLFREAQALWMREGRPSGRSLFASRRHEPAGRTLTPLGRQSESWRSDRTMGRR